MTKRKYNGRDDKGGGATRGKPQNCTERGLPEHLNPILMGHVSEGMYRTNWYRCNTCGARYVEHVSGS